MENGGLVRHGALVEPLARALPTRLRRRHRRPLRAPSILHAQRPADLVALEDASKTRRFKAFGAYFSLKPTQNPLKTT